MQIVKPLTVPGNVGALPSIRAAVARFAPRDELDGKALRGAPLSEEERAQVQARRVVVQTKCLVLAATVDTPAAEKLLQVAGWLERPPTPAAVDEHMLRVGLAVQVTVHPKDPRSKPEVVVRPEFAPPEGWVGSTAGRKAAHCALLSFKDPAPSSCGTRLYDIAMVLARHIEVKQRIESGSSHAAVIKLIDEA